MRTSGHRLALFAAFALALGAGVAWGLQTLDRSIPAGNGSFTVAAAVTPGQGGGAVLLAAGQDMYDDDIELSVDFDANGFLCINGQPQCGYDSEAEHSVTVVCEEENGVYVADITVVADGQTILTATESMSETRPVKARAQGESVASLTVN